MNKNIVLLSVFLLSNIHIHSANFNTEVIQLNASEPNDIYPDDIYPENIPYQFPNVTRGVSENWKNISSTDVSSATNQQYVISSGGNYTLTTNIAPSTASATSIIHINSDNVVLDLAGHTIDGSNSEAGDFAIEVSGRKNVTIQNGHITAAKGASIQIAANSSNVRIHNITVTNPADTYDGIVVATSDRGIYLKNITVMNDATASTGHGINVSGSPQDLVIDHFNVSGLNHASGRSGIVIAGGYNIKLRNGRISNIAGDTESDGILFSGACHNVTLEKIDIATVSGQGIDLNACYNVRMHDINIANVSGGHAIDISGTGYGIQLDTFKISNLSAATGHGINLANNTYGITLRNGTITTIAGSTLAHGIYLAGSHRGITLENIEMTDLGDSGIDVETVCDSLIMRNLKITNPTVSGIDIAGGCDSIIAEDIIISDVGTGSGIIIGAALGVKLSNIDISKGVDGINITAAENVSISNVNIALPSSDGIEIAGSTKSVILKNINVGQPTSNGINISGAAIGVLIDGLMVGLPGTNGIAVSDAAYGLTFKNVNLAQPGGDGINISGAADDITIEDFSIALPGTIGIDCSGGNDNVIIRNGTIKSGAPGINIANSTNNYLIEGVNISGALGNGITVGTTVQNVTIRNCNVAASTTTNIAFGAGCYGIVLDNVQSTGGKDGITFVGTAGTATIVSDIIVKNCNISGTTRSDDNDTKGLNLSFAQNILIQDTTVGKCNVTTAGEEAFGVYLSTCTNIKCENVNSSGHLGDGTSGFYLINVNGGVFNNCESLGNYAIDSTSTETCAGFFVQTSTAVTFNKCVSSGHTSGREAHGFLYGNATGCVAENCVANGIRNSATVPNSTEPLFTGFFSMNGIGNLWKNCIAENNFAGTGSAQDGEGAMGFYLSSELQSALIGCKGRGHGSLYGHTTNAIGIYLDNRRSYLVPGGNFMKKEDCQYCQVKACEASSNCTSALTGVTAYGIRDASTDTKNIIVECFAFGNSDSATPTRVVTNYNMDLAVGGQTPANWPQIETNMDSLIDLANTPDFYNVSITS